jgi:hypothetical protein
LATSPRGADAEGFDPKRTRLAHHPCIASHAVVACISVSCKTHWVMGLVPISGPHRPPRGPRSPAWGTPAPAPTPCFLRRYSVRWRPYRSISLSFTRSCEGGCGMYVATLARVKEVVGCSYVATLNFRSTLTLSNSLMHPPTTHFLTVITAHACPHSLLHAFEVLAPRFIYGVEINWLFRPPTHPLLVSRVA